MDAVAPGRISETPPRRCPQCDAVLSSVLEGMCPGCLLDTALGPPPCFPEDHFGDYALVRELAQGGTGVVYLARQNSLERLVALKMLTGGALASDAEMRRIHHEARIAASLKHPNIVPIYEVGVHEEIAYFTMPLMEGGSLAQQMPRFHGRFRAAAQLLETISRAVHHGHQRGILHQDLKPANVLLDAAGAPYVADFGLARALDSEAQVTQTGSVEGTLSYMPLEQACPGDSPLTVAVDVYSLGVILYELLTGRLPFEAESFEMLLARLREGRPLAPRAIDPRIPRSLEAICLECLEQEPTRRYGSAAELADELKRFLEDMPVLAMPVSPPARAWMWCLRQPLEAGLLATLIWALLVATVGTFRMVRELEEMLRDAVLEKNVFEAPRIAQGMIYNLEKLGKQVEAMATEKALVEALEAQDERALEEFCRTRYELYEKEMRRPPALPIGTPFERIFIENRSGYTHGRWPAPGIAGSEFLHREYFWRHYFKGAQELAQTKELKAYISRAYVSESHYRVTFALSVPVYGKNGEWLGVLSATVASNSTLGELPNNEPGSSNHTVTLVALLDRRRNQDLPPDYQYVVLIHDQLERGAELFLDEDLGKQIARSLPPKPRPPPRQGTVLVNYRDPVSREPELAAFAPVGDTSFVVISQTREKEALAATALLADHISWWSLPFALGTGLVWLVFWAVRSRSLGQRTSL
jgi:eukaryotic-like serine/threonine-protein kinase